MKKSIIIILMSLVVQGIQAQNVISFEHGMIISSSLGVEQWAYPARAVYAVPHLTLVAIVRSSDGSILQNISHSTYEDTEGNTFSTLYDFLGYIRSNLYLVARASTSGFSENEIIMWYGMLDDIPDGFQLCDGTNGSPDLRNLFVRGASNDSDITGTTIGHSTSIPADVTASVLEYNPVFTGTAVPDHTHPVDPPETDATSPHASGSVPSITSPSLNWSFYLTVLGNGENSRYLLGRATEEPILRINPSLEYSVDISEFNSGGKGGHTPAGTINRMAAYDAVVSGGDGETAPDHVFLYYIMYVG